MKYIKNNTYTLVKFFSLLIFIYPVKGLGYFSGIPYNTKSSFILLLLVSLCIFITNKTNFRLSVVFFSCIFFVKIYVLINPLNLWSVCVVDTSTPVQQQFEYEYIDSTCTKSFNNLGSFFTEKIDAVNYQTNDENFEWLGANASNFPLGYLNHAKFNFYDLRRDWLPFKMYLFKEIDPKTELLEITYIGEVTVRFDDGNTGYGIVPRYWNENTVSIKVPESAKLVAITYEFTKWKIKPIPTLKSGYPYEKYAKLQILEKNNPPINKDLVSLLILIPYMLYMTKKYIVKINKIYLFLFSLTVFISFINFNNYLGNDKVIYLKLYSYLCLLVIYLIFNSKKYSFLNFLQIFSLLSFVIIDYPWNNFDLTVKPGGSDSLTYENQSRLIYEGDGLRGGVDVFLYSPGYRYLLYLIHLFFGDFWNVAWIALLSCCVSFIMRNSDEFNPITFLFIFFLISDNVRNIFLYGMSEASSLMLFLVAVFLLKNKHNALGVFLLSIGVLVRPETGLFALFALFNKYKFKSIKMYFFFGLILLLPLLHNLYYGREFILLTSGWNYGRNLDFNFIKNLNYIVVNPFNQKILMTLGAVSILSGFTVVVGSSINFLMSMYKKESFEKNKFFIFGVLNLLPFLIYDPELFYPRHIIIGLCFLSMNEIYNNNVVHKVRDLRSRAIEKFD